MLYPPGDDDELACVERDLSVPELHPEAPLHDEEHLVLGVMVVPGQRAPFSSPTTFGLQWSEKSASFSARFTFSVIGPSCLGTGRVNADQSACPSSQATSVLSRSGLARATSAP